MSQITLEVLAEKMDGLTNLFNEKFKTNEAQHREITSHQKLTNGRVNKLEDKNMLCENWQAKAIGIFVAVNMIFLPIVFIIISKFL